VHEQTARSLRRLPLVAVLSIGLAAAIAQDQPTGAARPTTSVARGGCVTTDCHPDVKATPFVHGPVSVDACDACHQEADVSAHTFQAPREGKAMCDFCHRLDLDKPYVHQPVAEGLCSECHNPHGGDNRFLLRSGAGVATCNECHDDVTEGMPIVHGPVAAGACTACHQAHSSDNPQLLILTGRELCLSCHAALQKALDSARTVHAPVAEDCETCHRTHAAKQEMLLEQAAPALCLDCHSEIEERAEEATVKHDAVLTGAACASCHSPHSSDFDPLLKNNMVDVCLTCHDREIELADGSVLSNIKKVLTSAKNWHGPIAQGSCAACHQAHGGMLFRMLIAEYPPRFYSPFREESYALCFECHDSEMVMTPETTELTNFRNGDRNLHFLHVNKKVKGRTCRVCHEAHASSNPEQIRDEVPFGPSGWTLPIGFQKSETGGRCNSGCHRPYVYDRVNPVLPEQQLPGAAKPSGVRAEPEQDRQAEEQP
jgi:predicted CXXCH cytochrome family protein